MRPSCSDGGGNRFSRLHPPPVALCTQVSTATAPQRSRGVTARMPRETRSALLLPRGTAGRPIALRPHPATFHPHLGTTLWMVAAGAVDGSCAVRGQPVSSTGTARRRRRPSTVPAICPPLLPLRRPQPGGPADLPERDPSTLCTGPSTTAGVLCLNIPGRNSGVDGAERGRRIEYPMAGMTPADRRLYGGRPGPGRPDGPPRPGAPSTRPRRLYEPVAPVPSPPPVREVPP
jgi:hypothetical protein